MKVTVRSQCSWRASA